LQWRTALPQSETSKYLVPVSRPALRSGHDYSDGGSLARMRPRTRAKSPRLHCNETVRQELRTGRGTRKRNRKTPAERHGKKMRNPTIFKGTLRRYFCLSNVNRGHQTKIDQTLGTDVDRVRPLDCSSRNTSTGTKAGTNGRAFSTAQKGSDFST